MRLDASGNLLVGKTTTALATTGSYIAANGLTALTTDSQRPLILNRKTNDGDLIEFNKDSVTVGSISSRGGVATNLILRTATGQGAGIGGANSGVLPCDEDGLQDDEINLGASGTRWKDLYLSGGVVFGDAGGSGTSTSNTLDSYEEGTWTPTFETGTASTIGQATYTKIGRSVTLCVENLKPSDTTSSNVLKIQSLPFAPATGAGGSMGSIMAQYRDDDVGISCYIPNNVSEIRIYESSVTGNFNALSHAAMFNNSAGAMYFSITYFTT